MLPKRTPCPQYVDIQIQNEEYDSHSTNPASPPIIIPQLLPPINLRNAFQNAPIIDLNPLFLPLFLATPPQIQLLYPFQEVRRGFRPIWLYERNLAVLPTGPETAARKGRVGEVAQGYDGAGPVPGEEIFCYVGDAGDAGCEEEYAVGEGAEVRC